MYLHLLSGFLFYTPLQWTATNNTIIKAQQDKLSLGWWGVEYINSDWVAAECTQGCANASISISYSYKKTSGTPYQYKKN